MATFTCSAAQSTSPAIMNVNGTISRVVQFTSAVAFSAGDVVQMMRIPNGATIVAVQFANQMATGVITVNVGDGNDTSAYAASVVLSGSVVALTSMTFRGLGRSYSAEDTIDVQITAISTPAAVSTLALRVDYTMQNGGGQ